MYFITTKRMLEVCFSAHPNIRCNKQQGNEEDFTVFIICFGIKIKEEIKQWQELKVA